VETTERPRERRPRRRLSAFGVTVLSLGAFFAVLAVLAVQMAAGHDPALGKGERPRQDVLLRRILVTRVVEDPPQVAGTPGAEAAAGSGAGYAVAPVTGSAPAPVTGSAPAAAPVAAPAPAPAPVATGSS
jgi:hypothetical protein